MTVLLTVSLVIALLTIIQFTNVLYSVTKTILLIFIYNNSTDNDLIDNVSKDITCIESVSNIVSDSTLLSS